jgi:hypothetical protein
MTWQTEVLDLIAEMKREVNNPDRNRLDMLAIALISQDHIPLKMADNLNHWLELTKTIVPLHAAS